MVARTDLRPTRADDSLKKILNKVANPQTVPHGVKVAQPGEYVSFYDTTGTSHRWDGDAIAEYDARIAEGKEAIDQAKASLSAAEGDIIEARKRIESVETSTTTEAIASGLNEKKLLIGRDAIFTGTIDVAQLNVTSAMSAEIVSAMSVESKKLVVTEDAILNRATVVQSLVTPELIADRINVNTLGAQLVTSGAIQTDPAANRGVKITNAGVNAWDPNGVQTIRLNGANNLLMGSFQTADDSIGRIRIFNKKDPVNHSQNGFITFHAIGGTTASHGVLAYTSNQLTLSVREGNADGTMKPFKTGLSVNPEGAHLQGNLFLGGQFGKGGAIAAYSLSGGTVSAGGYVSFSLKVALVNGQRPWSVVQPSSSNFANLSAVTWTVDGRIEGRVYNNSNFAANNVWVDVLTFAIER